MFDSLLKSHAVYTHRHLLAKICTPLNKINIHGFIFTRRLKNNHFIWLSNELTWSTDFFLHRFMQEKYAVSEIYQTFLVDRVDLWSLNKNNVIWNEGEDHFNFGNGISIYCYQKEFLDIFCFYSKKNCQEMNKFYLENFALLKKFSSYFVREAQAIIKQALANPLPMPDLYQPKIFLSQENQTKIIDIQEFLMSIDPVYQKIQGCEKLTQREMECIKASAEGKSAKQVAQQLFISKRTIEKHLENAKFKLKCTNLNELIGLILKYGIVAKE